MLKVYLSQKQHQTYTKNLNMQWVHERNFECDILFISWIHLECTDIYIRVYFDCLFFFFFNLFTKKKKKTHSFKIPKAGKNLNSRFFIAG